MFCGGSRARNGVAIPISGKHLHGPWLRRAPWGGCPTCPGRSTSRVSRQLGEKNRRGVGCGPATADRSGRTRCWAAENQPSGSLRVLIVERLRDHRGACATTSSAARFLRSEEDGGGGGPQCRELRTSKQRASTVIVDDAVEVRVVIAEVARRDLEVPEEFERCDDARGPHMPSGGPFFFEKGGGQSRAPRSHLVDVSTSQAVWAGKHERRLMPRARVVNRRAAHEGSASPGTSSEMRKPRQFEEEPLARLPVGGGGTMASCRGRTNQLTVHAEARAFGTLARPGPLVSGAGRFPSWCDARGEDTRTSICVAGSTVSTAVRIKG